MKSVALAIFIVATIIVLAFIFNFGDGGDR